MPQTRVAVVGSANMDLVAMAPALPRVGETMLGTDFVMVPGGKGANQAVAAVRAGASCAFLGAIGSDAFGVTLKARITAAGVDTSHLRVVYGTSGVALVMVNAQGENAIMVTPGANDALVGLTEEELATVRAADVLVAQLEVPVETVTAAAVAARAAGTRVILNAAPARDLPPELLGAVDVLVVNEGEAQALAGRGREEPRALLELTPRAVLTLGGEGAWYVDRDGAEVHVPAVRVDVVDSTAAGDAFTAALAVGWGEGRDLVDAVRWASAAGAACVRKLGASVALPRRAEIDELYAPA
ncbi:ribokinase [Micromonospora parathelypteridis]|uniref:Ribokinase n=1 Tax=Micromonospora parathelypteridis TaxID=1839617 RepID=A0A840W5H0_9ACTN|nr:ribokinase [Micromonospora parathelypteridis]MBB5479459.1 ribokinase [Micromonospora parathelypteridis]GGO30050.1 ribokinase [Micromonospora parathelypteridis]